jgi:hypothetical protein
MKNENENKYYVYAHRKATDNEVFYIGAGQGKRWSFKDVRSKEWNEIVNECGYTTQIIKSGLTKDEAFQLEKDIVTKIGRKNLGLGPLVNKTDGGLGVNKLIWSKESKEKARIAKLGNVWSDEIKKKMSETKLGKVFTQEHKDKISKGNKNKIVTQETKDKISKAHKGKTISQETKDKIGKAHKGRILSDEHSNKISVGKRKNSKPIYIINKKTGERSDYINVWVVLEENPKFSYDRIRNSISNNMKNNTCKNAHKGFYWFYNV